MGARETETTRSVQTDVTKLRLIAKTRSVQTERSEGSYVSLPGARETESLTDVTKLWLSGGSKECGGRPPMVRAEIPCKGIAK